MIFKWFINLFNPFHKGWCRNCNHPEEYHRLVLITLGYPGARCRIGALGGIKFCSCQRFEPMGNLDYLEYKAREARLL